MPPRGPVAPPRSAPRRSDLTPRPTLWATEAPRASGPAEINPTQESQLYDHYERFGYQPWDDEREVDVTGDATTTASRDSSDPPTDEAMTRSEEELEVRTTSHEAGRLRLRKYVVTENVTVTVPVRKEKVRLERVPIDDTEGDITVRPGAELAEEDYEIVLSEEEPLVSTRTVPKERVRLGKDVVTEQRQVSHDIRKEQIEVDADPEVAPEP